MPRIDDVVFEESRIEHLTQRATLAEIEQVFRNKPKFETNGGGTTARRVAPWAAIGRTDAGRRLKVPFLFDEVEHIARPWAAYPV